MPDQRFLGTRVFSCHHGYLLSTLWLAILIGCGRPSNPVRVQDEKVQEAEKVEPKEIGLLQTEAIKASSIDDPIGLRLTAQKREGSDDEFELTLEFDVSDPYEIQSFRATAPKVPTEIELKLPTGFEPLNEWQCPKPMRSLIPGTSVSYSGKFECKRMIRLLKDTKVAADSVIECAVKYQACDPSQCLRPTTSLLKLTFSAIQ